MPKRVHTNTEWARFVRERRGALSQAALAHQFGVTGSYVSLWEQYGVVPSQDVIALGAGKLGDDPSVWLSAAGYAEPSTTAPPAPVEFRAHVPVGHPVRGAVVDFGSVVWAEKPARWGDSPLCYHVSTDTLHPEFRRGDALLFAPARTAPRGQVAIVAVKAQERMVRFVGQGRGTVLICPANAAEVQYPTELSEARVVGVLIELIRRWEK